MANLPNLPPLKSLHPESSLNLTKLTKMDKASTEDLIASLNPPGEHCLKTRPDGTILEGHHRVFILRRRGVDVDCLPRDVIVKDQKNHGDETVLD